MKAFPVHLFSPDEAQILARLSSPRKVQDFLEAIPGNSGSEGDTCRSPRRVIRERRAHCIEGAFLAAAAFWRHGEKPLLLDLVSVPHDDDHVVALFRRHGCWGAVSKTRHAVLRYREPVYHTIRELVMSYFHEYFDDRGRKNLRAYSDPFDLSKARSFDWLVAERDVWHIAEALNDAPHWEILERDQIAGLRRADPVEIAAGKITQEE